MDQKLLVNKLWGFFEEWSVDGEAVGWWWEDVRLVFFISNVTIKNLQGLILANNHETINDPFRVRMFLVFEN